MTYRFFQGNRNGQTIKKYGEIEPVSTVSVYSTSHSVVFVLFTYEGVRTEISAFNLLNPHVGWSSIFPFSYIFPTTFINEIKKSSNEESKVSIDDKGCLVVIIDKSLIRLSPLLATEALGLSSIAAELRMNEICKSLNIINTM